MTIIQVNTEAVSATGALFLADSISAGGGTSLVPYSKIMDGRASGTAVAVVDATGRLHVNAQLTSNAAVSITGALPAGTNQIGKVELTGSAQVAITNSTLAVTQSGAWNVSLSGTATVIIGNAGDIGGGTQYAVDTALGGGGTGTLALAERDDALSSLTPVEGDAVTLRVDSTGALWTRPSSNAVDVSNTAAVAIFNSLPAGTNQIGKVELTGSAQVAITNATIAVTKSGAWDVSLSGTAQVTLVNALPAGTNQIGKVELTGSAQVAISGTPRVIASGETSSLYDGTTALTPKFAAFGINSSGATTVISLVAAKKLRILAMNIVAEGAVGAYFQDNGTKILMGSSTDPMEFQAGGGMVLPYSPVGWCETSASCSFMIVPDTATSVAGSIVYVEV